MAAAANKRVVYQEAFKLALSIMLFYWLALTLDWSQPKYGALAVAVCATASVGASINKGIFRIVGTAIGVLIGFAFLAVFAQNRIGMMLLIAAYLSVNCYIIQKSRFKDAWMMVAMTPLIVWASTYMNVENAFDIGVTRFLETTAGVGVYSLVSVLLWPQTSGGALSQLCQTLVGDVNALFGLYKKQVSSGEAQEEDAQLNVKIAGVLAKFKMTLAAAKSDTPTVRSRKKYWDAFTKTYSELVSNLALWSESLTDCKGLSLEDIIPDLSDGLSIIERRLELSAALLRSEQNEVAEETELFEEISLRFDKTETKDLSHVQRAVVLNFAAHLREIDRRSSVLLRISRVLAGVESSRSFDASAFESVSVRPRLWDPDCFVRSLFPALCWIIGFCFWVFFQPPMGQAVALLCGIFSLMMSLGPVPLRMLLYLMLITIFVAVAPVYMFVMPEIETAESILGLVFTYTFVFGVLGGKHPLFQTLPIALFVMLADINNQQKYSFEGLMFFGVVLIISFSLVLLINYLLGLNRPERSMLRNSKRFFSGCEAIVKSFAAPHKDNSSAAKRMRMLYFESKIDTGLQQMRAAQKGLDYSRFPDNSAEKVDSYLNRLQTVSSRLQALEKVRDLALEQFPDIQLRSSSQIAELRERIQSVLGQWSTYKSAGALDKEWGALEAVSREVVKVPQICDPKSALEAKTAEQEIAAYYVVLGATRGLVEAMAETDHSVEELNWNQWTEPHF